MKKKLLSMLLAALFICQLAGASMATFATGEHEHSYEETVIRSADCDTRGIKKLACECGEYSYVAIPFAHDFEEVPYDASCEEAAKVVEICKICEAKGETTYVPESEALGHKLALDETAEGNVAATCTDEGVEIYACSNCDYTEEKAVSALGHNWNEGKLVEAGCLNEEAVEYTCTVCGEIKKESLGELAGSALGHKPIAVEDKVATCKEAGITGRTVCSVCGEIVNAGTEIPVDTSAHKLVVAKTLRAATCTISGIGKYACEICEADLGYKVISATHSWNDGEVTKEANCGKVGEKTFTCTVCGETDVEEIPAAGEHDYEDNTVDATCTEPEKVGKVCKVCGDATDLEVVEGSEALGHDPVLNTEAENYKAATCEEGGLDVFKCSRCDEYSEEKETEALGHEWGDGVHQDATCTTPAGALYTCECGETWLDAYDGDLAVDAKKHTEKAVDDIAPTCKTTGWTGKVVCAVCDEVLAEGEEVAIDATAHKEVLGTILRAASCDVNGIGKYVCEFCNASLGYKTIPAGHIWGESEVTKEATCGEAGEKTYTCTVCDGTKVEDIPATGEHSYEETIVPATCTNPEMVGKVCAVCADATELAPVEGEGAEALGHELILNTEAENYKAAICEEGGLDVFKCSRCDYSEEKVTEALGHDLGEDTVVDATCEYPAGVECKCSRCDYKEFTAFEGDLAVPATGHTETNVEDIAPTCKATGLTGKVVCEVCGKVLAEGKEVAIDADAHVPALVATIKEASCPTSGIGKYACALCEEDLGYKTIPVEHDWMMVLDENLSVWYSYCQGCDAVKIDYVWGEFSCDQIPNLEHVTELVDGKNATCTESGYTAAEVCTVCNSIVTESEEIPVIDHNWDEGTIITEATEETVGEIVYECVDCGESKIEEIEFVSHEHSYEDVVTAPTCTEAGYTTYTCACGDTYTDDEVEALGHTEEEIPAVEATCTEAGLTAGVKCSVCGEILVAQEVIFAKGHNYTAVVTAPTETEDGYTTYTCNCGDSYIGDIVPATGVESVFGNIESLIDKILNKNNK